MKLNKIGSNQSELHLDSGAIVFFSYNTPVAAFIPNEGYIRTMTKFSVTTTKHLNKWLRGVGGKYVPQNVLNNLVEG